MHTRGKQLALIVCLMDHCLNSSQAVSLERVERKSRRRNPTRQILLLLSYHSEALLLPLITGDSHSSDPDSGSNFNNYNPNSSTFSSQTFTTPSRSVLIDNFSCTTGLEIDFNANSTETKCSISNGYINDVNSLAWGLCGDNYDQHNDTSFTELLFVSGRYGVTVYAFPKFNEARGTVRIALEGYHGQGKWVEWGPSSTLTENVVLDKPNSPSAQAVNWTGADGEVSHGNFKIVGDVELSRGSPAKRWLQSFFTKVETTVFDGSAWTKFLEKTEFPCSAKVVSFNIFDVNPLVDFLCKKEQNLSKIKRDGINQLI